MATRKKFFFDPQAELEGLLKSQGELIILWQKTEVGHCLNAYALYVRQQLDDNGAVTRAQPPRIFYALFLKPDKPVTLISGQVQELDEFRKIPLAKEVKKEPEFQLSLYPDEQEVYIDDDAAGNWHEWSHRIHSLMVSNFTLERLLMKAVHIHTS